MPDPLLGPQCQCGRDDPHTAETHEIERLQESVAFQRDRVEAVCIERDEARRETERMWSALQAETATSVEVRGELRAEVERLRAVLALAHLPDPVYGDDYGARCVYCGSIEDGHAESCPWVKLNGALSRLDSTKPG